MLSIDKIFDKMFNYRKTYSKKMKEESLIFWNSISKKEIQKISDVVLQKPGTKLTYLDKYTLNELKFIFNMFPLEIINEQVQKNIDETCQYGICKLSEYRIIKINNELIKNIKNYKKYRVKLEKQNKGEN